MFLLLRWFLLLLEYNFILQSKSCRVCYTCDQGSSLLKPVAHCHHCRDIHQTQAKTTWGIISHAVFICYINQVFKKSLYVIQILLIHKKYFWPFTYENFFNFAYTSCWTFLFWELQNRTKKSWTICLEPHRPAWGRAHWGRRWKWRWQRPRWWLQLCRQSCVHRYFSIF